MQLSVINDVPFVFSSIIGIDRIELLLQLYVFDTDIDLEQGAMSLCLNDASAVACSKGNSSFYRRHTQYIELQTKLEQASWRK